MLRMIGAPKLVEIRRIHVDGAALVDMEKENVKEIEKSIQEGGAVIHPSLVDKKTGKIVCGRDRILAQMRFRKCALVQYVTGTEAEFARAKVEENLCRRDENKGALRAKLKELLAPVEAPEAIKARPPAVNHVVAQEYILPDHRAVIARGDKPKRGRPSEGKTAAVAELAEREGVSPKTVRNSIGVAKRKAAAQAGGDDGTPEVREPPVAAPRVSCLRTLGLEVPELVEDAARDEQKRVDRMARALAEFGAALTDHRKEQAGLNAADDKMFEEWEAQRAAMAAAIRRSRPACACPHCKVLTELMPTCAACRGTGYISEEKLEGVEACLLAEGDDSGVWVPTPGKRPQWRTMISLRGEDFE